jgi:hypothetical protein
MTVGDPFRLFILCSLVESLVCDGYLKFSTPVTHMRFDMIVNCRVIDYGNSSANVHCLFKLLIDVMLSSSSEGFIQVKFKGKVSGLPHMF